MHTLAPVPIPIKPRFHQFRFADGALANQFRHLRPGRAGVTLVPDLNHAPEFDRFLVELLT